MLANGPLKAPLRRAVFPRAHPGVTGHLPPIVEPVPVPRPSLPGAPPTSTRDFRSIRPLPNARRQLPWRPLLAVSQVRGGPCIVSCHNNTLRTAKVRASSTNPASCSWRNNSSFRWGLALRSLGRYFMAMKYGDGKNDGGNGPDGIFAQEPGPVESLLLNDDPCRKIFKPDDAHWGELILPSSH